MVYHRLPQGPELLDNAWSSSLVGQLNWIPEPTNWIRNPFWFEIGENLLAVSLPNIVLLRSEIFSAPGKETFS